MRAWAVFEFLLTMLVMPIFSTALAVWISALLTVVAVQGAQEAVFKRVLPPLANALRAVSL
jgi:hypothetical protein